MWCTFQLINRDKRKAVVVASSREDAVTKACILDPKGGWGSAKEIFIITKHSTPRVLAMEK